MTKYNELTPSIEEIKEIGFKDVSDKFGFPRSESIFQLKIEECSDILFLRVSYENGWYWSIKNWDKCEARNCRPIFKISKIKQLISILKGN